jgi:SulP family sulfate permease
VIGIVLSLGWLVYASALPATPELGRQPGTTSFRPLDEHPDGETVPGVYVMRFDGGLYFLTTEVLSDRLRDHMLAAAVPVEHIVLDLKAVNFIDAQGVGELDRLVRIADERHVSVRLASVEPATRRMLALDGVIDRLGEDHVHTTVHDAVDAALHDRSQNGRSR